MTTIKRKFDRTYQTEDGKEHKYPVLGQGPAVLASEEDLQRDEHGLTNPNLHRRIDPQAPKKVDDERNQELLPRGYKLNIQHVHSYRTTTLNGHDEDSEYSETP